MKIEDILKGLITVIEQDGSVEINSKECRILLEYIADLQRKEYNNSKAIEYIDNHTLFVNGGIVKNILEKGE